MALTKIPSELSSTTGIVDNSNATAITIDSNENVGIGTASPSSDISSSSTVLEIADSNVASLALNNTTQSTKFEIASLDVSGGALSIRDNNSERMRIDSSGNVGIGTSVSGAVSPLLRIGNVGTGGGVVTGTFSLGAYGTAFGSNIISSSDFSSNSSSYLTFGTTPSGATGGSQPTERMRIDSSGNVGIGTSSPNFSGFGSSTSGIDITNTTNAALRLDGNAAEAMFIVSGSGQHWFYGKGAVPMTFSTNGSEAMRIDSSGNVGIAISNPTAKLHIEKQANLNEAAPHFAIKGAGYVGSHWLDGNAYYIGQNSTVRRMRIYSGSESSGVNLSNGQTSWGTFSDERLKYDVEPVENAVESLSNLRTVKYRLKDVDSTEDKKKIGLMAQDLVGVLDEVIDPVKKTGDDTEYMSVRYTELVPVLVKAIQELEARITQLENN